MGINTSNADEFIQSLKEALSQEQYMTLKGIVYFWKVEKPIPRVFGASNVLYIGRTVNSLSSRYLSKQSLEIERRNFVRFYNKVFKEYGSLSFGVKQVGDPKFAEWEELSKYYNTHLDYPPLNRNIPKRPKL